MLVTFLLFVEDCVAYDLLLRCLCHCAFIAVINSSDGCYLCNGNNEQRTGVGVQRCACLWGTPAVPPTVSSTLSRAIPGWKKGDGRKPLFSHVKELRRQRGVSVTSIPPFPIPCPSLPFQPSPCCLFANRQHCDTFHPKSSVAFVVLTELLPLYYDDD